MIQKKYVFLFAMSVFMLNSSCIDASEESSTPAVSTSHTGDGIGGYVALGGVAAYGVGHCVEPCVDYMFRPAKPAGNVSWQKIEQLMKPHRQFMGTLSTVGMFGCACAVTGGSLYELYQDYKEGKKDLSKHALLVAMLCAGLYGLKISGPDLYDELEALMIRLLYGQR